MKKVLFLFLASFLVLTACGNKEESKSEDKKETESSSKDDKKKDESKKSNDDKKDESNKEDSSNAGNTQQDESQQANAKQQTQNVEQTQEQVNTEEQQPVQSVEQAPAQDEQQNSQGNNNEQSNVPAGDAMFGEYKDDGSYCTVGGCLTPEQQKDQEEANYEEMENQGYSREEYDEIQNKAAELQQQRDNGEISSEEFTDSYLELYD
ncbi:hypothetical protein [Staphylococcus saprophyticus]|uniref:hypothetical protein n=1 Tax=Staphylococcus saprophyticus TaxID=29385 RepID=UPI001642F539|nr:hypothetical protein [Staphylococcus saprophyticus]MDW4140922.1 hypothetical protein [Staphylococcus saprophyticus]